MPRHGESDARRRDRGATEPEKASQDLLDPWYLDMIAKVESLPENQNGSDKSWVFRSIVENEDHFSRSAPK